MTNNGWNTRVKDVQMYTFYVMYTYKDSAQYIMDQESHVRKRF